MSTPTTDAEAEFKAWSLLNPPENVWAKLKRMDGEYAERKQRAAYELSKGVAPVEYYNPAPRDAELEALRTEIHNVQHLAYTSDAARCDTIYSLQRELRELQAELDAERANKSPTDQKLDQILARLAPVSTLNFRG